MEILAAISLIVLMLAASVGVTLTFNKSIQGFASASEQATVSGSGGVISQPTSILPAQPATLTTRTSGTAGTLTMTNTSHGIITGQRVDLYWVGGQSYGLTVGTVSGTTVPFTTSEGTALPIATTLVSVGIATSAPFECIGNNVLALMMSSPNNLGQFTFNDGSSDVYNTSCTKGYAPSWKTGDASANPLLTFVPTKVWMSHNNTTTSDTSMLAAVVTN